MKKGLLIIFLVPLISFGQVVSVDTLLHQADSIRFASSKLKDKDKVKSYEQVLVIQDSVYNLMADSIRYYSSFEKNARAYNFFVSADKSVFLQNFIDIDIHELPRYMQVHYMAVMTIRLFGQCIENMDSKISSAEADKDVAEADKKNYVAIKIKSEIDKANDLLDRIDKLNMSSFSEEQNKYYQGLLEKLNNILNKYIF